MFNKLKRYVLPVIVAMFIGAFLAFAQTTQKILILKPSNSEPIPTIVRLVRDDLRTKNKNINIDEIVIENDDSAIAYINKINPTMVLLIGKDISRKIAKNTSKIPIVVCDLFTSAYMETFTDPRIIIHTLDIRIEKRIEYIDKILLNPKIIGVIYNPTKNASIISDGEKYATDNGLILKKFPVTSEKDIQALSALNIDVLLLIPDSLVCGMASLRHIILLCVNQKVPMVGISEYFAETGTIIAVATNFEDYAENVSLTIDQLLQGADPATIPDSYPKKLDYFINKAMAIRKNVTFKKDAIANAKKVFGQ